MHYQNWSALDMALVLELALQKDGDTQQNVRSTLTRLSDKAKVWKRGDESLGEYCKILLQMPDPAKSVRDVVDNFYKFLTDPMEFEPEPVEAVVEVVVEGIKDKVRDRLLNTTYEQAVAASPYRVIA